MQNYGGITTLLCSHSLVSDTGGYSLGRVNIMKYNLLHQAKTISHNSYM